MCEGKVDFMRKLSYTILKCSFIQKEEILSNVLIHNHEAKVFDQLFRNLRVHVLIS